MGPATGDNVLVVGPIEIPVAGPLRHIQIHHHRGGRRNGVGPATGDRRGGYPVNTIPGCTSPTNGVNPSPPSGMDSIRVNPR